MADTLEERVTTLQMILLRLPEELDGSIDVKLEERIAELELRIHARFAEIDGKLDDLLQRLPPMPSVTSA